jgi:hypothetical protein
MVHLWLIYLLKMVIFHGYGNSQMVKKTKGKGIPSKNNGIDL